MAHMYLSKKTGMYIRHSVRNKKSICYMNLLRTLLNLTKTFNMTVFLHTFSWYYVSVIKND